MKGFKRGKQKFNRSIYQSAYIMSEIIHKIRTTNICLMLSLLYTNIKTTSSLIDTRSPILPPSHKLFSHRPGSFQCPSKGLSKNFRLCHQHSHKVLKSLSHPLCLPKLENSGQDCHKEKPHLGHSSQKVNKGNQETRQEKINEG